MADESWFVADQTSDHDFDVDEFSNIDEETLRILIQSLEPEVDMNQDSDQYQLSDLDQLESCCSASPDHDHLDFEWLDMEMDYSYPTSYNFNGHDFTEKIMEEITMVDQGLPDYSQLCYGMTMEEDDHYIGLWQ